MNSTTSVSSTSTESLPERKRLKRNSASAAEDSSVPCLLPLSKLCKRIIAKNIERYPPKCFAPLAESEWESVVMLKYRMTMPKFSATTGQGPYAARMSNTLSGGRRQPVLPDKTLHAIERHNPHLSTSTKIDEMVWKDCVDYKFKRSGPSRPPVLEFPWALQVKKMEKIAKELPLLLKEPKPEAKESKSDDRDEEGDFSDTGSDENNMDQVEKERTLNLRKWCLILKNTPMCVPLLSETGVGKAVKKFIKECKKYIERGVPEWFPDITCNVHPYAIETGTSLLMTMEGLLNDWKLMASADQNSSQACTLRTRNTPEDQHIEDFNAARASTTWRTLFHALQQRESAMIKNKGAKMRKIRDNLASDRPKMQSALTKQKRPGQPGSRLKNRLLYGDVPSKSSSKSSSNSEWGSSKSTMGKMSKLRNESAASAARIAGRVGTARNGTTSASSSKGSFSASVLSSSSTVRSVPGKKRKATTPSSTARQTTLSRNTFNGSSARRNQRVFELNGGMSIKLPKVTKRRK